MMQVGENNLLFYGDWHDALLEIEGAFDAVLTDPPYGIKFVKGNTGSACPGEREKPGGGCVTKRNNKMIVGDDKPFDPASIIVLCDNVMLFGADHFRPPLGGRYLVFDKLAGMSSFDSFADAELIWHSRPGVARICSIKWKGIAREKKDGEHVRVHPFQKPLRLMTWCVGQLGQVNCVFDPFMGSGTTGVACARAGIPFIGAEIDNTFFDIAVKRLSEE